MCEIKKNELPDVGTKGTPGRNKRHRYVPLLIAGLISLQRIITLEKLRPQNNWKCYHIMFI